MPVRYDVVTARELLTAAVWHGHAPATDVAVAQEAHALAVANQVQGTFARCYPEWFPATNRAVADADRLFRRNLRDATALLVQTGVEPVLIKAELNGDYVYSNFDLVVGRDGWEPARAALARWTVRTSGHALERTKVLLHPVEGPAAHLHEEVSWFDVPVISSEVLREHSAPEPGHAWWRPDGPERLRIWVAHALFQNLAFDLSELMAVRDLLDERTSDEALLRSRQEGWGHALETALVHVRERVARLDAGEPVRLPTPVPLGVVAGVGAEHVRHLLGRRRVALAARETALRPLLIAAKRRRLRA